VSHWLERKGTSPKLHCLCCRATPLGLPYFKTLLLETEWVLMEKLNIQPVHLPVKEHLLALFSIWEYSLPFLKFGTSVNRKLMHPPLTVMTQLEKSLIKFLYHHKLRLVKENTHPSDLLSSYQVQGIKKLSLKHNSFLYRM
jgi:hypothetical protein